MSAQLYIDKKPYAFTPGETIFTVASRNGIFIPTLCYKEGAVHKASCMVCAVKNCANGQILPSCSSLAQDGMDIASENPEISAIRKSALELLLSDHRADCEAPCRRACPGSLDIAAMNRYIEAGQNDKALLLLRNDLVFPASLCFICKAPCENICRRAEIEKAVPIREIKKRLVREDKDMLLPTTLPKNGKKAAVGPSTPASLGVAWQLMRLGWEVTIFDAEERAVRPHLADGSALPDDILQYELDVLRKAGIRFALGEKSPQLDSFDAVVEAGGGSWQPNAPFSVRYKVKHPARLVEEGIKTALQVHRHTLPAPLPEVLHPVENPYYRFQSTFFKLDTSEKEKLRESPLYNNATGCLFCDCDAKADCRLRSHSSYLGCTASIFNKESKRKVGRQHLHGTLWFEPAKCISCGLCVYNTNNGATFQYRGFDMVVAIPHENAPNVPETIAELCPTGALCLTGRGAV